MCALSSRFSEREPSTHQSFGKIDFPDAKEELEAEKEQTEISGVVGRRGDGSPSGFQISTIGRNRAMFGHVRAEDTLGSGVSHIGERAGIDEFLRNVFHPMTIARHSGIGLCMKTLLLIPLCLAAMFGACTNSNVKPTTASSAPLVFAPVLEAEKARSVMIYRGNGASAVWADLVAEAQNAEVVILAEQHGHPVGLGAAAALWRDVLSQKPNAALALEFFERDEQYRLDEFLSGLVDEAAFVKRAQRTVAAEGNYPPGHRDMILAAKEAAVPVVAANAPRPIVRKARTDGYDALRRLSAEQQRMFRIPDALPGDDSKYKKDFYTLMGSDPTTGGDMSKADGMFRSQSMWDWTMSESVVRTVTQGRGPVVLVVGQFHTDFRGGLVQAMLAQRPATRFITVSFQDASPAGLREEDRERADYVVYTGPRDTR